VLRVRVVARFAGVALAAAGLCAVTVAPAQADAVRDQEQWVLDMMHAQEAWQITQGKNVTVAVIDSGVFPSVSDLAGSVIKGPNLSGVNTPQSNGFWGVHGTWMASLIAGHGHGDGTSGIVGIAPQSRVLSIRVVTDQGDPNFRKYEQESNNQVQKALARAITDAANRGASVISMSLGYGASSRAVRLALQYALGRGVVVVASSGNSGDTADARRAGQAPYSFPADYPGVLGVGAVTESGTAASFSSDNLSVEVAAPGVQVPAQGRDGQYWLVSGTSPACALTAGVAALIKSAYPHLSPALVDQAITSTTQNPPPGGYDDRVGFGTVDAAAALAAAARLTRSLSAGRGAKVTAHFGGGPAAAPLVPVPPRSQGRLILYGLLVLVCLAIAGVTAARLTRMPRAEAVGGGPWPGSGPRPLRGPRLDDDPWARSGPRLDSQPAPGGQGWWDGERGSRPDDELWPTGQPQPGNGSRLGDQPRPASQPWQGNGARPGNQPRPGSRPQPANGSRPGDEPWLGRGPQPNGEPWRYSQTWSEIPTWPGNKPLPEQPGRPHTPGAPGASQRAQPTTRAQPAQRGATDTPPYGFELPPPDVPSADEPPTDPDLPEQPLLPPDP
jgi:Subtilase family